MEYGLLGLLQLALIIWAVLKIMGSTATTGAKFLWILLVIVLPLIGFIIWFFAGPK